MDGATLLNLLGQSSRSGAQIEVMPAEAVRFSLIYAASPELAAERDRVAAALGTRAFSLTAAETDPGTAMARILTLQFPDVRRTLSDRAMFDIAAELADRLGLEGCEPDVGARVFVEPDPRTQPILSPESAIIGLWCSSDAAAPADGRWALDAIRVPAAWAINAGMGDGILIGQPDTGVADHDELAAVLDVVGAVNILEGGAPTDPLSPDMFNPGHGTATASVVASRAAGLVTGAAPGARVVPIRCVNSVVLFDAAPVAAAVAHARRIGCDVVTMSLGGIVSAPLRAAIGDAVDAGIVVLAAAGNCVGFVTYPASDPRVIAVAAVDAQDKPWRGSSSGSRVDVSAPGENVTVAVRRPGAADLSEVGPSQGTSFAVAMTAGVAALWIAHHGKARLRAVARARGITVNELFRAALRETARKPDGWKPHRYGAGVVNAAALLKLAPEDILAAGGVARTRGSLERVSALAIRGLTVDGFDWARHGAEASLLAAKAAIASRRATIGFEAVGRGVLVPSQRLAATAPAILRAMLADAPPPQARRSRVVGQRETETLLRLASTSGGGLESAAAISAEAAQRRIRDEPARRALVEQLDGKLQRLPQSAGAQPAAREKIAASASSGLAKMARSGTNARLTADEHFALEALVSLQNRPALRVRDDKIDPADPMLGDWTGTLFNTPGLTKALGAVGRVNLDGVHIGTGWVIAPGLVATNRHVLEGIAEEFADPAGGSRWVLRDAAAVNFHESGLGAARQFALTSVVSTGPDRINGLIDFRHLDMAVLAVETTNAAGNALPKPLPLLTNAGLADRGSDILLCGYPARPDINALRDPDTGVVRDDVVTRLQNIFGLAYSVKYVSPGQIGSSPGTLDGDSRKWVFGHDATTLGGSSGSWAIYLGEPMGVVGLHFGGGTLRSNYAHAMASVRQSGILPAAELDGASWI